MMMWYSGVGSGLCGVIVNVLAMVLLWGAAFTAIVLAAQFLSRERSNPAATRASGPTRAEGFPNAPSAGPDIDSDEFYKRLM
jgi:hypothetical protein